MAIMATPQVLAKTRPAAISYCMWLFFISTVGTANKPALVKTNHSSPPSTLVLYIHENQVGPERTTVIAASRSGNGSLEFGTIAVITNVVREGAAGDSPVLGQAVGQITIEKDASLYIVIAYALNTTSFTGSITVQGPSDPVGNGELAITGGTGVFRFARGYVELSLITEEDRRDVVYQSVLYTKYN